MKKQKLSQVLVILGTSRKDSNTLLAIKRFCPFGEYELIDLNEFQIHPYDYDPRKNQEDDFIKIARKMLKAEVIIFATPVYWYSMSGPMKVFFDRLTDLLNLHKPIGKALRGKKTYLISSGGNAELPEGFEIPFRLTSKYFDMDFQKTFYQQN